MSPLPLEQMIGTALFFAPLVWGLTEAAKKAGLAGQLTVLFVLLLGPTLTVLWWAGHPEVYSVRGAIEPVLIGLIASLLAMGLYKSTKALRPR